jgi:hypothetical protein
MSLFTKRAVITILPKPVEPKPVKHTETSQTTKVYKALKQAGKHGLYNYQLANMGILSWHRRIGNLRADGCNIQCVRVTGGQWKYFLNLEDE